MWTAFSFATIASREHPNQLRSQNTASPIVHRLEYIDHSARVRGPIATRCIHVANSSSNALASFRSSVSKPSVNQP